MAQSSRSGKHKAYYEGLKPRVAKRKDRNVKRSSHGAFENVAALVAHQRKVEGHEVA